MTARRAALIVFVSGGLYALFLSGIANTAISPAPDFPNYYYSATYLAEGRSIYTDFSDDVTVSPGSPVPELNYLADPPPVAVLFYPAHWLHWLSYEAAWWLLILLSGVAMIATVWVTGTELGLARPWLATWAGLALLTTSFRYLSLTNHFEVLLALLAAIGWVRIRKKGSPGPYWGIAASLKLFPALWTVAFIRSRRTVAAGFGAFVGVMLLTAAIVGPADFVVYVRQVVPLASQWYEATGNYSLMSVGSLAGGAIWGYALTGLGVVGFAWTVRRLKGHNDALYVAGVAWSLLLSPLSWLNYLVVAVSPLMVAVPAIDWGRRRQLYPGFVMLVGLLAMRPVLVFDSQAINIVLSRIPTVSLLLLAVWAPLLMARNQPKASAEAGV